MPLPVVDDLGSLRRMEGQYHSHWKLASKISKTMSECINMQEPVAYNPARMHLPPCLKLRQRSGEPLLTVDC